MARDAAGEVGRAGSWRALWATGFIKPINLWLYSENNHIIGMVRHP